MAEPKAAPKASDNAVQIVKAGPAYFNNGSDRDVSITVLATGETFRLKPNENLTVDI